MIRSLSTAGTGMVSQQYNLDTIANNLANVNTTGFKRSRADFQDLLYQSSRAAGTASGQGTQVPTGVQVGLGTRAAAIERLFTQGDFRQTSNPLDMVIEGDGFFQIQTPDGQVGYTRDGSFKRNSQGQLVNVDGYLLQPALTIPPDATQVTIAQDGTVSVQTAGKAEPDSPGKIEIARFTNPGGLEAIGRNIYRPTAASGAATTGTPGQNGYGTIGSGMLEMSNVKVIEEMVDMITAQRAYEVNSKSIQASDEMLQIANSLRR